MWALFFIIPALAIIALVACRNARRERKTPVVRWEHLPPSHLNCRCVTFTHYDEDIMRAMRKKEKKMESKFKIGDGVRFPHGAKGIVTGIEDYKMLHVSVGGVPITVPAHDVIRIEDAPRFKPGDRVWFAGTVTKWFSPMNGHPHAEVKLDGGTLTTRITEGEMAQAQPIMGDESRGIVRSEILKENEDLKARLAAAELTVNDLTKDICARNQSLAELRKQNAGPWTVDDLNEITALRTQLEAQTQRYFRLVADERQARNKERERCLQIIGATMNIDELRKKLEE